LDNGLVSICRYNFLAEIIEFEGAGLCKDGSNFGSDILSIYSFSDTSFIFAHQLDAIVSYCGERFVDFTDVRRQPGSHSGIII